MLIKRKLYSQVEEKLFARGKNMRDLGKGNKKLNKSIKREKINKAVEEFIEDYKKSTGITMTKEEARYMVLFDKPSVFEGRSSDFSKGLVGMDNYGSPNKPADINILHNRITRNSGPYKLSSEDLMNVRKLEADNLRQSKKVAKVAKNKKIALGVAGGLAVAGIGAYLAKKHYDKKKSEKKD